MNRVLKLLIALGVIGAVAVLIATQTRKRATTPRNITPTPWKPPVVDRAEEDPAVADAESEGMTPPAEEPAVDVAVDSSGELLVSELSVPGSTELMRATVAALETHRVVLWSKHGAIARSDQSVKRAVDRIEYAETTASYEYLNLVNHEQADGLTADEIKAICAAWNIEQTVF
mgnify:CR=1 FL=1